MHRHAVQIDAGRNIITSNKPDTEFRQAKAFRQPRNGTRGRQRIGRAEVAEDGNARARRIGQGLLAINPIAFDDSDAAILGAAIKECMA